VCESVCEPVGVSLTHLGPPVRNFRLSALELHHRSERLYVPLLIANWRRCRSRASHVLPRRPSAAGSSAPSRPRAGEIEVRGFDASGRSSSRIKDQARLALSALCSSIRSWSIVNRTSAPPTSPCWICEELSAGHRDACPAP
jgi:hypothetical protein